MNTCAITRITGILIAILILFNFTGTAMAANIKSAADTISVLNGCQPDNGYRYTNTVILVPDEAGFSTAPPVIDEDADDWESEQEWKSKYEGPEFNAQGNEVSIETMELVHEGVSRVD